MIEEAKAITAAIGGSALAAITGPDRSKVARIIEFLAGFAISVAFTGAVIDYYKLSYETYSGAVGFCIGYFGMTVASSFRGVIVSTDWAGIIKGRLGGGK